MRVQLTATKDRVARDGTHGPYSIRLTKSALKNDLVISFCVELNGSSNLRGSGAVSIGVAPVVLW